MSVGFSTGPEESAVKQEAYYLLECYWGHLDTFSDVGVYPDVPGISTWMMGSRFDVPVPEPIRLEWDPESSGPRKHLYKAPIPLFHRELISALRGAGVDNLDCYRAEILDVKDRSVTKDYLAVNVIGVISAADMSLSRYASYSSPPLIDVDFDLLIIDPAKTLGARLFRLAERVSGIVMHREVKEHLESLGGFGLTFIPPSDWVN
jgi:hypothetical protein